jgi:hypothetical protein
MAATSLLIWYVESCQLLHKHSPYVLAHADSACGFSCC